MLLFVDSIREMRKYSVSREEHGVDHGHLDAELQYSMKLFRAQRNFYIAGFALFLCLSVPFADAMPTSLILSSVPRVIRRLVLLIQAQATLQAERDAALAQAKGATAAAQTLLDSGEAKKDNKGNDEVERREKEKEIKGLREQLSDVRQELAKVKLNEEAVKKQAASVTKEYDRLLKEHESLQRKVEGSGDARKDR